jgi:osmoprotectant transport system substrate-binding protein
MARLRAIVVLLAIVAFGGGVLGGTLALIDRFGGKKDRVVVGSKAFTESIILAEIIAQWLERSGLAVERHFDLGATNISFEAIKSGAVDLYPEYTGTGLMAILQREPVSDPREVLGTVRAEFESRYGILWLDPLGFDNTYALAVPEALSARLGIRKVSDLLAHRDLRAGFASEFLARTDGWPGLSRAYDLTFREEPRSMEAGLMYQAAASGQVDVISAYSTDGRIDTQHLRILEDDRHFFPPYEAVVMVRKEALAARPRLRALLRALEGTIHDAEMRKMNAEVDFGSRSVHDVAAEFLTAHEGILAEHAAAEGDAGR